MKVLLQSTFFISLAFATPLLAHDDISRGNESEYLDDAGLEDERVVDSSEADARNVAWCVGGPARPAYAFHSYGQADACYHRMASEGPDCRRFAKLARCRVYSRHSVGQVAPSHCICNPARGPVGTW